MNSLRQFLHAAAPRGFFAIRQLLTLLFALPAAAGPLLTPSTPTYGGIVSGGNFVTGSGTSSVFSGNRWPFGQEATKAVDGLIGPGSKYLNLNITDTALIFSGTTARAPARLELWVAEDAVERDPTSYTLYGSSAPVPPLASGSSYALSNFTQIASGTLALPDPRDTTADGFGYSQIVPIPGSTAYVSYLLVFPTVKDAPAAANSMQISEVQLYADGINAVESADFSNDGPGPSFFLEPGVNRISGTLLSPSDLQDRFSVIVPAGTRLLSVSDTNAFNSGVPTTFPLSAGTYPVLFSTNFAPAPGAPWSLTLTVESVPSTLPIIGVESFDYPDGPIATKNGGTFWDYKNFSPTAHTGTASPWENVTAAPAIASGRLVTQNSSAKRTYNGASEENGAVNDPASFPSSVAKSVYYRVTVTTGATVPTEFGLSSYDFGTEKIFFGKRAASSIFLAEETGVGQTGSATTVLPNTTYTLVAMVDYAANIVRLYLNPDLNAPESTQPPAVTRAYTGTNWSTAVRLASSGGSPVVWDNLVVATAWDVLGTVVTTTVDEDNLSLRGGGNGISLREAVKYAPAGGLITFAPGLSGQTITLTHADGDMEIPTTVIIDASGLPGGLTLSGNNTSRHFDVQVGKNLALRGLTLTRGNGSGGTGGSIRNRGSLILDRCAVSGNASSSDGGAVYSTGTLRATDSTFSENLSGGFGGGINLFSGTAELTRCTLSGNTGSSSGALVTGGTTVTLSHCTIVGNRSTGGSTTGGIFSFFGTLTLQHCAISQNTGNGAGGGLSLQGSATVNVANSIIAGNADPGGTLADIYYAGGTLTPTGTNLIGNNAGAESQFPATANLIGTAAAPVDPKLSPLGYFGGPVQTMHPLIGSPAIDAAGTTNPGGTDARGFPRFVDGNNNAGAQLDIGAVEAGRLLTVLVAGDTAGAAGANNFRSLMASAPSFGKGTRLSLSTGISSTITLAQGDLTPPADNAIFIDASNLPNGLTLSGNSASPSRVFNITSGATVAMHSVRIVNGNAANGGGILNKGTCTLMSSTLSANTADTGGGIYNDGSFSGNARLSLTQCTISGNQASATGGGIVNSGTSGSAALDLTSCTVSGNSAGHDGGGIYNQLARLNLSSCTVSGNNAGFYGGGIYSTNDSHAVLRATLALNNTILAGNSAGQTGPNLERRGTDTTETGTNLLSGSPLLAPLGDYGGPTQTMPPLRGSPAIDAAAVSSAPTDQRGVPRIRDGDGNGSAAPDIGAVEASLLFVTGTGDTGAGTLRQALADAAAFPGPDTVYFTAAVTPHITLAGEILITDPAGVTLDASDRPTGVVIDAGTGTNRHFRIASGTTAVFNRLRLYGGNGTGGGGTSDGGSIHTSGTLTLRECMIADCTSPSAAGAILSDHPGVLTLERCTLYGNSADSGGGAIAQLSQNLLTLTACTIANNTARFEAGGINAPFGRPVLLDHCTVSGNSVTRTGANGVGGVRGDGGGVPGVTVRNSIISGNTDANSPGTPNIGAFRTVQGNNVIDAPANLAALGDYGGPAWTMPPRAGSPAIDAATSSAAATDQRGVGRPLNGDDFEFARADIGAVEVPVFLTVTTRFDDNETPAGPSLSLREAIRDAEPGATILFAPNFDGEEFDIIRLSQSLGEIVFTKGLILDASANTGGVTVDGGPGANRIFYLGAGSGTSLHRLTLTGGGGAGATDSGIGGAIYCRGATLALTDCALHGNSANLGGAILNYEGTLTMDRCLLTSNSCLSDGGAVRSKTIILTGPATSATTLTNCTLAQNTAPGIGGGFYNFEGRANLRHCTVTGNSASASAGSGVASYGDNKTRTTAQNCIIAGNTNAGDVSFINGNANSFVSLGGNVIGSGNSFSGGNSLTAFNQPGDTTGHTAATARLAPLADYGGLTQTIALRPGSPARDIATPSRVSTDQRGFPASGPKDSGAYEAGNYLIESYTVFAQELLPHTATDPQRARAFDLDGDGQSNEAEWLAGTNPGNPGSVFSPGVFLENGDLKISFPTVTGRTYRLQQSSTLLSGSWVDSGLPAKAGNNALQNFIVTPAPSPARRFWRVTVSQP